MASCAEQPYPKFSALLTPELRARLSLLSDSERAKLFRVMALELLVKDRPFQAN